MGNLRISKNLSVLLQSAGFTHIRLAARYECYPSLEFIGEFFALQHEQKGFSRHATTLRKWAKDLSGVFGQAWVSAFAKKSQQRVRVSESSGQNRTTD
ncbi:hypothetical protein [Nitrospira sp. Ecomares 2.1]